MAPLRRSPAVHPGPAGIKSFNVTITASSLSETSSLAASRRRARALVFELAAAAGRVLGQEANLLPQARAKRRLPLRQRSVARRSRARRQPTSSRVAACCRASDWLIASPLPQAPCSPAGHQAAATRGYRCQCGDNRAMFNNSLAVWFRPADIDSAASPADLRRARINARQRADGGRSPR